MRRNKYIEDLGIKREDYGSNFVKKGKIQRFIERRMYGFDYRDTINMDLMWAEWIYSRLTMLMEQTYDDLTSDSVEFEGEIYTIEQAFERIRKASRDYLYYWILEYLDGKKTEDEVKDICNEMKAATRLWAEVMDYADRTWGSWKFKIKAALGLI